MTLNQDQIQALIRLADSQLDLNQLRPAEKSYRTLLRHVPAQAEALYGLAEVARRRCKPRQQRAWLEELVAMHPQHLAGVGALAEQLSAIHTPLLVGELSIVYKSGGGGEMIRRYTDFAGEHGWAVSIWTLKELTRDGGVSNKMWMVTTNAQPIEPIEIRTAPKDQIEAAFRSLATMPLAIDEDVRHWQTTPQLPAPLPSTQPTTEPR